MYCFIISAFTELISLKEFNILINSLGSSIYLSEITGRRVFLQDIEEAVVCANKKEI